VEETLTDRLLAYLRLNGADFQVLHHEPVRTSEEAARVRGTPLEQGAKALVFRADERLLLVIVPAHRRVDTRVVKRALGIKNLRMIDAEELMTLTGLEVGAVPPFGNLLDLPAYVDERLVALPRICFNAGSRTTSVILATADFVRLANPTIGRFAAEDEPASGASGGQGGNGPGT
jgi:Ala-tRNA(Pro) deacylase